MMSMIHTWQYLRLRATSMKTRIETSRGAGLIPLFLRVSEQHPWKQGLKPDRSLTTRTCLTRSQSNIHENKDWNLCVCQYSICPVSCLRATSMKTRIETRLWDPRCSRSGRSQSNIHENKDWNSVTELSSVAEYGRLRATSMKTRIETTERDWTEIAVRCLRATSMKTRIETSFPYQRNGSRRKVSEQHPWKQGLKLLWIYSIQCDVSRSQSNIHENKDWNLPLRRGENPDWLVSEQHPWKQGLKPYGRFTVSGRALTSQSNIHENKDWNLLMLTCGISWTRLRATSMKTRIETPPGSGRDCHPETVSEQHPWKQGLKPKPFETLAPAAGVSEQHPWKQGLKQLLHSLYNLL